MQKLKNKAWICVYSGMNVISVDYMSNFVFNASEMFISNVDYYSTMCIEDACIDLMGDDITI